MKNKTIGNAYEYVKDNLNLISKLFLFFKKPIAVIVFSDEFEHITKTIKKTFKNLIEKNFIIIDGKKRDSEFLKFLIKKRFSPIIAIIGGKEKMSREARTLVESLPQGGSFVYNFDNENLRNIEYKKSSINFIGFGFQKKADLKILEIKESDSKTFKIDFEGKIIPLLIEKNLKRKRLYEILLLLSIANCLNINFIEASQAIKNRLN